MISLVDGRVEYRWSRVLGVLRHPRPAQPHDRDQRSIDRASRCRNDCARAISDRVAVFGARTRLRASLNAANAGRLTRGQVATRLGISVSTVRRLEGTRLHPTIDGDDVRWFDEKEVTSLAAELVNTTSTKRRGTRGAPGVETTPARSLGEIAALVFERFEQRQSLAEIVVGLRATETVRALFDQWSLGLTEGQLRMDGEPALPRASDLHRVKPAVLAARLADLPDDPRSHVQALPAHRGRARGRADEGTR